MVSGIKCLVVALALTSPTAMATIGSFAGVLPDFAWKLIFLANVLGLMIVLLVTILVPTFYIKFSRWLRS